MRKFNWLVLTNCTLGDDAEFNRWYDEEHIPDLLRIPGVVGVRRGRLSPSQMTMAGGPPRLCGPEEIAAKYAYLAVYAITADDPDAVLAQVRDRAGTERMPLSPTFREAYTILYEDFA